MMGSRVVAFYVRLQSGSEDVESAGRGGRCGWSKAAAAVAGVAERARRSCLERSLVNLSGRVIGRISMENGIAYSCVHLTGRQLGPVIGSHDCSSCLKGHN